MKDRYIKYYLFHLIKDVSETSETIKTKGKQKIVSSTTIKRRYLFNKTSWLKSINTWTYHEDIK